MKPNAKRFEIKLEFNETPNLVKAKNSELMFNSMKDKDKLMQFKILRSNYLADTKIKYGVCYLTKTKKALDIVPIDKIYDFQTDFTYLDCKNDEEELLKQDLNEDKNDSNSINKLDQELVSPSSIKLQNFTLRYETNFEYSTWSHVNYVNLKERTTKEQWKKLKLIDSDIQNLGMKKIKLTGESSDNQIEHKDGKDTKYCLLPKLIKAKSLQLSEKINRLLINCKVIPFCRLITLLACDSDDELILIKLLQKSAMLVQGVWVIKSELLYSSNSLDVEAIIHDFISYLFTKSSQLRRDDINSQIKFPLASLMIVLDRLAKFNSQTRTWHFIYPTDSEFLNKHDTIRQQMEISWEIRRLQIMKNLFQIDKFREKSKRQFKQTTLKKKKLDDDKPIKKRLRKRKSKV